MEKEPASDFKEENVIIKETALPLTVVASVVAVQMCEAINMCVLFPFLAFFLEYLGYSGESLGIHAGMLAASFCMAQFLSSAIWGRLSDIFGRKPIIVIGIFGCAIGQTVFGLAGSYYQAMIGRIFSGLLSGNLGALKCYLSEVTDDTNRARGFSYLNMAWSLGSIIAPLAGGLLCKPAEKFPAYFSREGLFGRHPYFLPCLLCVVINGLVGLFCLVYMKESRFLAAAKTAERQQQQPFTHLLMRQMRRAGAQYSNVPSDESKEDAVKTTLISVDIDDEMRSITTEGMTESGDTISISPLIRGKEPVLDENDTESVVNKVHEKEDSAFEADLLPSEIALLELLEKTNTHSSEEAEDYSRTGGGNDSDADDGGDEPCKCCSRCARSSSPLCTREVVLSVSSYGLLAMCAVTYDETLPLFLKLEPGSGGFGLNSSAIGLLLSVSGLSVMLFAVALLPTIARQSSLLVFRHYTIGIVLTCVSWPLVALLDARVLNEPHGSAAVGLSASVRDTLLWILLILTMSVKGMVCAAAFTASIMQVNCSVSSEHLGAVNGVGQSVAALLRAVGPALGGALWSASLVYGMEFLSFVAIALLLLLAAAVNACLPPSIDRKKSIASRSAETIESAAGLKAVDV